MERAAKILIVDDTLMNRKLLRGILSKAVEKYEIVEADSGKAALEALSRDPPDIVLLDVMMPEMDGFEVCQRIKADEKNRLLPILFITAMEEMEQKVKAFKMGGADYITKPINAEEVRARVSIQIRGLESGQKHVAEQNVRVMKDMIATYNHNMNQPLMAAYMYLDGLLMRTGGDEKTIATVDKIKKELNKMKEILCQIQALEEVKRTDYVGESGMMDLEAR